MTDSTKVKSGLHDGEPGEQPASLPAQLLGEASTRADQQAAEVRHADLDTEREPPTTVEQHLASDTTSAAGAPKLAQGDDERPLDPGTQDLGWCVYEQDVVQPLLSGMKNKDLWLLERRFNKQAFRVRRVDEQSASLLNGLDCNIAEGHEFSPDRLRATIERFYTSVILSFAAFFKHLARLRSWHETRRSAFFALLYALSWVLDKTLVGIVLLLILLIVSPRSRRVLFPPAPLAAISATSGKPKVPEAQHLGSTQSLTGAAETYEGQAAEREAANLVSSLSTLAVSTAIGSEEKPVSDDEDDDDTTTVDHEDAKEGSASKSKSKRSSSKSGGVLDDTLPDPSRIATSTKNTAGAGAGTSGGVDPSQSAEGTDQTAAPVDNAVWGKAAPVLYILEDICDTVERFGNALSPVPPFSQHMGRLRLAGVLAPLALGGMLLSPNLVYRSTTLGLGIGFFGQPAFDKLKPEPILRWLDKNIPHWRKYLQLRNTILRGAPTNAQLTVTLLRIGEAHSSPLPPPPLPVAPDGKEDKLPKPKAHEGVDMADHPDLPPEYREEMRRKAAEKEREEAASASEQDDPSADQDKKDRKKSNKILGAVKFAARSLATSALGLNRAEATVLKSENAKARLGVVKKELAMNALGDGPAAFKARYRGKRGLVIISTSSTTPCVSFEPRQPAVARAAMAAVEKLKKEEGDVSAADDEKSSATKRALEKTAEAARVPPLFSIQIEDIDELSKRGGLGWKTKMLVSWALDSDIADGLEVITKDGKRYRLTAMPRRDEVFNRLIALSPKTQWELA